MRPAWSVLFLTTLIGAGQGLFLAAFTVQDYALLGILPAPESQAFFGNAAGLALLLLASGLVASFFHLGHPERAWRAASQWRTSWLSREVIALPAFMAVVLAYAAAHWLGWRPVLAVLPSGTAVDVTVALGALGTVLAFALFLCTAMIYACLPFLREWHSPLTVVNFVLMGGASGFSLAAALAGTGAPGSVGFLAAWALALTAAALAGRIASIVRNARLAPRSTMQSAIGVRHPRIVQRSQGAMGGSFNTREFFHGRSAATVEALQAFYLAFAFALPMLLLALGAFGGAGFALLIAFPVQYAGLLAERWVFFAQARHPQNLYYQTI